MIKCIELFIFQRSYCKVVLVEVCVNHAVTLKISLKPPKTYHNFLLAHLSRRLEGELIHVVYPWSGVRPSSSVVVHNFKHEHHFNQWADHNKILSEASLGWGKGCIRFWARFNQNSGFHGNR